MDLKKDIDKELDGKQNIELIVTGNTFGLLKKIGHGIGGAYAILYALMPGSEDKLRGKRKVIVFGSPLVLSWQSDDIANKIAEKISFEFFIHRYDIIPRLLGRNHSNELILVIYSENH